VVGGPSRRLLLGQAAALAGASLAPAIWTNAWSQDRMAEDPFALGVASGDPAADSVVLWTRLAPRPKELTYGMTDAPVPVRWEIAEDPQMQRIAEHGEATAQAKAGHAVQVEVHGLKPDREYWYRFTAAGHQSPVGRTRTAPEPGAKVERLRIAYGSCQKWESGFYAAHAHLAAERPDLILFLGDYIYEKAANQNGKDPVVRLHPPVECLDLASYRQRYAWYKADPNLQAAHAAAPWIVTWDDHEVANDYGDDADRTPTSPDVFLKRRAAAYRAYWENMPLRRAAMPRGADMTLYRALDWGRLARIALLDDRQFRDRRTCDAVSDGKRIPYDCAERLDTKRSLLGRRQERWLDDRLTGSDARWNLLGQQTLMGELRLREGKVSNDGWDGYPGTRRKILETWRDAKVANPVALGGDIHCFFAGDLALERGGAPVATEFVGGSISSLGSENRELAGAMLINPHLKYAEGETRGYGLVDVTPKECRVTFRGVENAQAESSPVRDLASFIVADGRPGVQRA